MSLAISMKRYINSVNKSSMECIAKISVGRNVIFPVAKKIIWHQICNSTLIKIILRDRLQREDIIIPQHKCVDYSVK